MEKVIIKGQTVAHLKHVERYGESDHQRASRGASQARGKAMENVIIKGHTMAHLKHVEKLWRK